MKKLISWLQPPHFENEMDIKRARVLYPIVQVMFVVYLALSIYTAIKQQMMQFFVLQVIGATLLTGIFLIIRGEFEIPGYIIPMVILLGTTLAAQNGQGIHDITMLSFPMTIALSGFMIGKRAAVFSTVGGIICVAYLIHIETSGVLLSDYREFTDYGDLFIISLFLVATAIIVYKAMDIISENIEELKRLNEELEVRVAQRTAELESSNKELEAFAYTISHDLRAPLRSISGYSSILQQDFQEGLDETGQRYLLTIHQSAKQMNTLIDEILSFSKTSRQGLTPQELSAQTLKEIIQGILAGLIALDAERQIEISMKDLPGCFADPILLKQVYVNLLSNAFKFTRQCSPARIEIGYEMLKKTPVYYVRDNGAGFDMAYADKLFGVFQRLHRQDEYEGTGVGLAIVQRIILRHGGKIWAEAALNQGATFYFTLNMDKTQPKTRPEQQEQENPVAL